MKVKALFLDRDGVINIDKKYVYKIEDFEFCDGIFEFCKYFLAKDFLLFVVTNQSGIARGYYKEKDFFILCNFMLNKFQEQNVKITKIYHCPHLQDCECRKPKAGMLLKARDEFQIDMQNSILVGDNLSDMQAGKNACINNLFLVNTQKKEGDFFKQFDNLKAILNFFKEKESK
ncbi:HAD family hydrolase [Campylobacter hepaticus]|nr:D-glycero-beta-D-manno-heptose 1,7-bisphosphate 7-phosphatase [Campylobacter hepaticus]MPV62534.1 D-glycero-beta-D-manno-heptose 1,7-bisphosphate 7-phosphatase [Campylobacter hepaticus]MPV77713.1 D-glycero-beta-D-manno-heptose 1,7-bisphosphate 7-phosphatase [Campylobacter hepaticus]MPV79061.1 D-glycero-beta-D-manno-heptose 1,7-bisphosphate 7-phosphatase [Campylobacter hepaticus]MPV79562.1 D-glycero-beta-D-manno-heptose 1,7-bisphosphate 7-phosphatase [Campylobacter hepaticus]